MVSLNAALVVLCLAFLTILSIYRIPLPFWDMVKVHQFFLTQEERPLAWLSSAIFDFRDNEHRPYVAFLFWGIDWELTRLEGQISQGVMFALVFVVAYIGSQWRHELKVSGLQSLIFLASSLLLVNFWHATNLLWDKQLHVYLSVVCTLGSLWLSSKLAVARHPLLLQLGALLLAVLATFSFGYGLVVWPLLLLQALLTRRPACILWTTCAAVGTIAYYLSTYEILAYHDSPLESLSKPFALINFMARLLGPHMALPFFPVWLQQIIGGLGLGVVLTLAVYEFWSANKHYKSLSLPLLICLFSLGVALLTALTRVSISSPIASRYLIIQALYVIGFFGLFVNMRPGARWQRGTIILFFTYTLACSATSVFVYESVRRLHTNAIDSAIAYVAGTQPTGSGLFPGNAPPGDWWSDYLAIHSDRRDLQHLSWLGRPWNDISAAYALEQSSGCEGAVLTNHNEASGSGPIEGWARMDEGSEYLPKRMVALSASQQVIGLGTTGHFRQPEGGAMELVSFQTPHFAENLIWLIRPEAHERFVLHIARPQSRVNALLVTDGESYCSLPIDRPVRHTTPPVSV